MKMEKDKSYYLLVYYTNPRFGGIRELFYLPDGEIGAGQQKQIIKNAIEHCGKNKELDSNYPYYHYFSAKANPIKEDNEIWHLLKKLAPKPFLTK